MRETSDTTAWKRMTKESSLERRHDTRHRRTSAQVFERDRVEVKLPLRVKIRGRLGFGGCEMENRERRGGAVKKKRNEAGGERGEEKRGGGQANLEGRL